MHRVRRGGCVEEAGVETRIVARDDARPNLVARVAGAGEAPPLLLYGHVDVVTTAGQRWAHDPFGAELVDGVVWGRGALDMKGGVAMLVDAFLRAARGELTAARRPDPLRARATRRTAATLGAEVPRARSTPSCSTACGTRSASSAASRRSSAAGASIRSRSPRSRSAGCARVVRGPGGHASMPQRGGAMGRLGRFLRDLDGSRTPVHVTPVARALRRGRWPTRCRGRRRRCCAGCSCRGSTDGVLRLLPLEQRRTVLADPPQHRDGDDRPRRRQDQRRPERGRARARRAAAARASRPDDLIRELHDLAGDDVELEVVRHDPGPPEPDLAWLDGLGAILRELDPEGVPLPLLHAGRDRRPLLRRLGIQTYGFLPLRLPADFKLFSMIHAADERVPADAIRFGAEAVGRAVERYAG